MKNLGVISKKSLSLMAYGFGDVQEPRQDSIDLLEKISLHYMVTLLQNTEKVSLKGENKRTKISLEDLMFILRKDKKKLSRMEELLYLDEVFNKIRRFV